MNAGGPFDRALDAAFAAASRVPTFALAPWWLATTWTARVVALTFPPRT